MASTVDSEPEPASIKYTVPTKAKPLRMPYMLIFNYFYIHWLLLMALMEPLFRFSLQQLKVIWSIGSELDASLIKDNVLTKTKPFMSFLVLIFNYFYIHWMLLKAIVETLFLEIYAPLCLFVAYIRTFNFGVICAFVIAVFALILYCAFDTLNGIAQILTIETAKSVPATLVGGEEVV